MLDNNAIITVPGSVLLAVIFKDVVKRRTLLQYRHCYGFLRLIRQEALRFTIGKTNMNETDSKTSASIMNQAVWLYASAFCSVLLA